MDARVRRTSSSASTAFFVIQYQSLLAQAKSTEVAAQSSWIKARAALQGVTVQTLVEQAITEFLANHVE